VKFDALLSEPRLAGVGRLAREVEELGYDGIMTAEVRRDPFLPLAIAAEHTRRLQIGTSVAVALPRNPVHLAQTAHDLQQLSGGRCILGLGSQVRAHIENRFSAEWSHPAARMEELVLAVRAIWRCWNEGAPLDFEGRFHRHVRMPAEYTPGPSSHGPPKVFLGAVGETMTEVVGAVGDGLFVHSFATERFLRQVTLPALERGLARTGRRREEFEVCLVLFVVTGRNEEEIAQARDAVRQQVAFYGSTPAYRTVLEVHGWGELQSELNRLSKLGRWKEMADLVPDEILAAFSVDATRDDVSAAVQRRYGGLVDRVALYAPYEHRPGHWANLIDRMAPLEAVPLAAEAALG
jgi:probable F420-dependent oxidoreductase